jgi:hypothetical protein
MHSSEGSDLVKSLIRNKTLRNLHLRNLLHTFVLVVIGGGDDRNYSGEKLMLEEPYVGHVW